jgi:hypothetical protein
LPGGIFNPSKDGRERAFTTECGKDGMFSPRRYRKDAESRDRHETGFLYKKRIMAV